MKMPKQVICEEILESGPITFARFMELALYCPETGYYETDRAKVGRQGDFITNVSVGNLFGEMVARQCSDWLSALTDETSPVLAEAGAHDGRLMADMLDWFKNNRPDLTQKVRFVLLEPSPRRQAWQQATLQRHSGRVEWYGSVADLVRALKTPGFKGVLLSNELLDAFPVHRLKWDAVAAQWFEWGVGLANGNLTWTRLAPWPQTQALWHRSELVTCLPDGYLLEISPSAQAWWRDAASFLTRGCLMAVDYGFVEDCILHPSRARGTLRAYRHHGVNEDVLANPGEQDITAHVHFHSILEAGAGQGLRTDFLDSQARFLAGLLRRSDRCGSEGWDPRKRAQFQTLIHPDHFGRAFQVLIQSR